MPRAQREAQLIDIAEKVLVERGYLDTTVEEIAERAGITKPVIYDHFGSKDGLLGRVITRAHEELEAATTAAYEAMADPEDARAFIYVTQLAWFTFIDQHSGSYALLRQDGELSRGKVERIRVKQAELVAEALGRTREFAATDQRRRLIMAGLLVAASERYATWWLDNRDLSHEEAAEELTDLIWKGFCPKD
ncbi:MAG: TetR/AcrR family transcriptional regulator [Actinomycetia bacterium]|nr:TetR/AcrR family transcriptional regulator [Actinomycetes bacterium]